MKIRTETSGRRRDVKVAYSLGRAAGAFGVGGGLGGAIGYALSKALGF